MRGKEDAFDEVMKYLVAQGTNSDFRYISIKEFISYLESRYQDHRDQCESKNLVLQSQSNINNSLAAQLHQNARSDNFHLQRATKEVQTCLDNLANQARTIAEEEGPLT